jgi:ribonuclease P protein component
VTIRDRADFLRVRGGPRWSGPAFLLELRERRPDGPARFGFTVTRKLGNAVVRNRIKRRLRHAVRAVAAAGTRAGCDYVIVARPAAVSQPFADLQRDLSTALRRVHGPAATSSKARSTR